MNVLSRRQCLSLVLVATLHVVARAGEDKELPDYTHFDLAKHGIEPVRPQKDARTGFIVGGVNATERIKGLAEINGRTIGELEADMRPGAKTEVGSEAGFLGKEERLLDVLATDNAYVVDKRGLTHQALARHLHALPLISMELERERKPLEFRYHGRRFRVALEHSRGFQLSPFKDGTKSGSNATVTNLDNGQSLSYGLLVPYMIERYGFYEGEGTSYRVDPQQVVRVLDFLGKK